MQCLFPNPETPVETMQNLLTTKVTQKSISAAKYVLQGNAVIKSNKWKLLLQIACNSTNRRKFLLYNITMLKYYLQCV